MQIRLCKVPAKVIELYEVVLILEGSEGGAMNQLVAKCHVCQCSKYMAASLQTWPIPNAVWEEISMDFITRLPKSKGFDTIWAIVDRLSKYTFWYLCNTPIQPGLGLRSLLGRW